MKAHWKVQNLAEKKMTLKIVRHIAFMSEKFLCCKVVHPPTTDL